MGGSSWSTADYTQRKTFRATNNQPTFQHHAKVTAGLAPAVHDDLNVFGPKKRESRDSAAHPTSRAVVFLLDETGSMREVPKTIQGKLPTLMTLLLTKGFLPHPHLLIGGIGDAGFGHNEKAPLQISQFEADIKIEESITNLFLEGNGGGNGYESYDLAMYYIARHTSIDCFEKRGQKGYCFIVGDERIYPKVDKDVIKKFLGEDIEADIPAADLVKELTTRYEVYFIQPAMTSYYKQDSYTNCWKELLGERLVFLDDPALICETIAGLIAINEGFDIDSVSKDLSSTGLNANGVRTVSTAIASVTPGKSIAKVSGSGKPSGLVNV